MTTNEYVKYITEQIVTHLNKPYDERKKRKKRKQPPTIYMNRWFGLLPFALRVLFDKTE